MSSPELTTDPHNANAGTARGRGMVERSLQRYGAGRSIVVDKHGTAIAGNTTLEIARELGIPVEVIPSDGTTLYAIQRTDLDLATDVAAMELGIADNRSAEVGLNWSVENLDALMHAGVDTDQFWFPEEMAALYPLPEEGYVAAGGTAGNTDPDDVPERPETATTKTADIWQLGRHRLMCGDATDSASMARLFAGVTPDLILTDPPYCSGGFQESGRAAGSVGTDAPHKQVANDRLSTRGYQALLKQAFANCGAPYIYAFTDWRMWVWLFDIVESNGYGARSMIVWDKGSPGMGRGWRSQHELVLWGAKSTPPWDKHAPGVGNVITCPRSGNEHHTTEKPVELIVRLLENTPFAEVVADPFAGSGTTLVACEKTGRTCYAVELDPGYCDVVVRRWEDYTGQTATRVSDGAAATPMSTRNPHDL